MQRSFSALVAIAICAMSALVSSHPALASSAPMPGRYYLALGDSITYGYQQAKFQAEVATGRVDPASFNTGFAQDFYQMLRAVAPGIQMVNYACPGATTVSFTQSTACSAPLHDSYSGSQFSAALAFLTAHPGQVSPITLNLGNNDILQMIQSCGGLSNSTCVASNLPATVKTVLTNLTVILAQLHAASPGSEIILLNLYNPFAAADPTTNALAIGVDKQLESVAAATGAKLADVLTPFNLASPQPQTICSLTLFCTALHDIHPSDAGYLVMAQQVWNASGYAALGGGFMVSFNSTNPGHGEVYFGSGPGCKGLVEVATLDRGPTPNVHIIWVNGNDMPGTVGNAAIASGVSYSYENVTVSNGGSTVDNNGGACYSVKPGTS